MPKQKKTTKKTQKRQASWYDANTDGVLTYTYNWEPQRYHGVKLGELQLPVTRETAPAFLRAMFGDPGRWLSWRACALWTAWCSFTLLCVGSLAAALMP